MTANLTTATTAPLLRLLQVFDAESLGEGDMAAGANILAAKCIALANSYPPGACLVSDDGSRLTVGVSFALIGGLTNSLITEKVIAPLARLQNNLVDHIAADATHYDATLAAMPPSELCRHRPPAPAENPSGLAKLDLEIKGFASESNSSVFRLLLALCRNQGPGELKSTPAVFLDAGTAAGLAKQLSRAHCRYPFVRAELPDGPEAERLESILLSVLQGTSIADGVAGPVHIRGHVAASCTAAKLARSVGDGDDSLLANLLWLVDGKSGELSSQQEHGSSSAPYATHLNYTEALEIAWARRLDYRQTDPMMIRYAWPPRQREWVALLQKFEPRCPGLTRAARPLFATLVTGLLLLSPGRRGEQKRWTDTDTLVLAKFLVMRMVNCREQLTQTERDAKDLDLAIKLLSKLEDGPLNARELVRKTNRLLSGDCRRVLELYDRLGVARRVANDKWELMLPVGQAVKKIRGPYVEV
ncbi:MAG: hypothetical protein RLZZ214_71 [Verrucomicrobiota bacterium]|jgi:hypothetical protein